MASTTLNEVVLELQEQNRTLDDVKEGIKAMLSEDIMARKKEERSAGDKREAELEASRKKSSSDRPNVAPRSFTSGLSQGLGLDGILQGVSSFSGMLGGATVGGLIGTALGRLFPVAVGAILGATYFDKWIDPLVDKITGDDATWTMFGKEIDASKIVSGMAGVIGVIFAKDAIVQTAKGLLGIGDDTKLGNYRKLIVRRFGLGALAIALSGVVGTALEEASGGVVPADVTSAVINGVSLAMMFMPGGILIKALAGFAIAGGTLIRNYLSERAERSKAEFLAEVENFAKEQELHKISDAALIAKANKIAEDVGTKEYYGRGTSVYSAVEQEAYLRELEKRDPKQAEKLRIEEEIAYMLAELNNAAMISPASVNISGLQSALNDYKDLTGTEHSATSELEKFREIQTTRVVKPKAILSSLLDDKGFTPSYEPKLREATVTKVDVGARYTPNVMPKPGTAGFSLTDMFGSGNSFTNGTIQNVTIGTVDNSTNVVGGGKGGGNTSTDLGSSIDYYHLEKRLVGGTAMYASGTFNVRKY